MNVKGNSVCGRHVQRIVHVCAGCGSGVAPKKVAGVTTAVFGSFDVALVRSLGH